MNELKPCPFCGVVPRIKWEAWEYIGENAGVYVLEAPHGRGCFIRAMDGGNYMGQMSSLNITSLVEAWNRRADNAAD